MAPKKKQVQTLRSRSQECLALLLQSTSQHFLKDDNDSCFDDFTDFLETLRRRLCNIPARGQPAVARVWLKTARQLTPSYESSQRPGEGSDPQAPTKYTTAKINFAVKSLVLMCSEYSQHIFMIDEPHLVDVNLLLHLGRMKQLKALNCGLSKVEHINQKLLESLPFLRMLTEFQGGAFCTDETVKVLCENCCLLETVQIRSDLVTDGSINFLASVKKLKIVHLSGSQISQKDLLRLLLISQSACLAEINLSCSAELFENLVADVVPFRTFNLRFLNCNDPSTEWLPLIATYFPFVRQLTLNLMNDRALDISPLNVLENLERVGLCLYLTTRQYVGNVMSTMSPILTQLVIDGDSNIDINCFLLFGLQCPNLKSISFSDCSFSNDVPSSRTLVSQKPFQKLRSFLFVGSPSKDASFTDLILRYAINITDISFLYAAGLTDEYFSSILQFNDLKELESLYLSRGSGISLETIKFLILNCPNISSLGSFVPIDAPDSDEFKKLQKFVAESNFDLSLH